MAIEYNNKSLIGTGSSSSPKIVIEAASIPATPESDLRASEDSLLQNQIDILDKGDFLDIEIEGSLAYELFFLVRQRQTRGVTKEDRITKRGLVLESLSIYDETGFESSLKSIKYNNLVFLSGGTLGPINCSLLTSISFPALEEININGSGSISPTNCSALTTISFPSIEKNIIFWIN